MSLRRLLIENALARIFVKGAHQIIEQPQRFGPVQRIFRKQRRLGLYRFQMIDDRPKAGQRAPVQLHQNRQMR